MVMLDDEEDEDDWWEQMSRGYEPLPMPADTQSALDSLGMEVELNLPEDYDLSIGEQQEYTGPGPGTFELDEPEPAPQAAPFADTPLPAAPQQPYSYPSYAAEPGNVDLSRRPHVQNPDGSTSTVRSMGVNIDGKEYLIPTVSDDGRVMGDDEAIETFKRTGKHLGVYSSPEESTRAGTDIHLDQERNPPAPMAAAQGALPAPGEIETTPKEWAAAANAATAQPAPYNEGTELQQQPALQAPPPAAAPPAQADKTPGEAAAAAVGKQADDKKAQNQEGSFWGPLAELGRADNAWVLASISDLLLNKGRGVGQIMGAEAQRSHELRRRRAAANDPYKQAMLLLAQRRLDQSDRRLEQGARAMELRREAFEARLAKLKADSDPNSPEAVAAKQAINEVFGVEGDFSKLSMDGLRSLMSLVRQRGYLHDMPERIKLELDADRKRIMLQHELRGLTAEAEGAKALAREQATTTEARAQSEQRQLGTMDATQDLPLRQEAQRQASDFAGRYRRRLEMAGMLSELDKSPSNWKYDGALERLFSTSASDLAALGIDKATLAKRAPTIIQKKMIMEIYLRDLTGAAATDPETARVRDQLQQTLLATPEMQQAAFDVLKRNVQSELIGGARFNAPAYNIIADHVGWGSAADYMGSTWAKWQQSYGDRFTQRPPPGVHPSLLGIENPSSSVGSNPDSKVSPPAAAGGGLPPPNSTPAPDGSGFVADPGTPDGMKWIVLEQHGQAPDIRPVTPQEEAQLKGAGGGKTFRVRDATPEEIRRTKGAR